MKWKGRDVIVKMGRENRMKYEVHEVTQKFEP